MAIFKVYYQDHNQRMVIREATKAKYFEADTIEQVRKSLAGQDINIEHVEELTEAHLQYEQASDDFKVEKI